MEWGEKYLDLYHKIELYYKGNESYSREKIEEFKQKMTMLNQQKKPEYHVFAKLWVEKVMDTEFTYQNEKKPWYK